MVRSADVGAWSQPSRGRGAWERALRFTFAVAVVGFAGCGGDPKLPPAVDADVGPPWWQPKAGEVKNWDIQLSAPFDVSASRVMYDLDLWALVPSMTTLDYGDGDPVTVPEGVLGGTITQLHARTPSTIVICHVETGALEMNRPDARKFPAAALGSAVPDLDRARFLDISAAGRAQWASIMWKRFDLARSIGCDGIEPSHNDVGAYLDPVLPIAPEDTYSWYDEIVTQGHNRQLSTGMKDADYVDGAVDQGAPNFDWMMNERCGETNTCDVVRPFIDLQKPVFALDYDFDSGDDTTTPPTPPQHQLPTVPCMHQQEAMIADGLYKDVALTSSNIRTECDP